MNGVAPLIEVEHLTMRFGGLLAIDDVSFGARAHEITAIIGPNGAGKTTVFNCITGFYKPTIGRLILRGDREFLLERMLGHEIGQRARVARTFQNIRLFPGMTVLENLMVAQHNKLMKASGMSVFGLLGLERYRSAEAAAVEKARGATEIVPYWVYPVEGGARIERQVVLIGVNGVSAVARRDISPAPRSARAPTAK